MGFFCDGCVFWFLFSTSQGEQKFDILSVAFFLIDFLLPFTVSTDAAYTCELQKYTQVLISDRGEWLL